MPVACGIMLVACGIIGDGRAPVGCDNIGDMPVIWGGIPGIGDGIPVICCGIPVACGGIPAPIGGGGGAGGRATKDAWPEAPLLYPGAMPFMDVSCGCMYPPVNCGVWYPP